MLLPAGNFRRNALTAGLLILLSSLVMTGVFAATPQFETRAIWIDPSGISSARAIDKMLARCARAGINLILPNVMCDQTISFKSPHFKGKSTANDEFDPLACVISKAHASGIKVQPWCCVYYQGGYQPAWLARSIAGKPLAGDFLSPSNPEVNPYLLSVIKDLLAYDIDGIHLDYIRYPGTAFDYSDAGRKAFKASAGFDPQDFLDHPERIVPAEQERFPVRVLYPSVFADKIWELTAIERTLDQAGIGFAFVSEFPENLAKLRVPGLLIISSCYKVSPEMLRAIQSYVARGGSILWTDAPATSLADSPGLRKLTGLAAAHWIGPRRIALQAASNGPLARALSEKPFRTDSLYGLTPQGAEVIAKLDTGEPVMTLKATGKGQVLVLGFHLMKSTSPVVASLAKEIVDWLKSDAGITGPDLLGEKRAEWVAWRGDRVTELVRDISQAARQKNPACSFHRPVGRRRGSSTLAIAMRAGGWPRESTISSFP